MSLDQFEAGPLDLQRTRLWLQMLKAVKLIEGDLRERLRLNYAMTLPRFDVLAALDAAPDGLRMSELSKQLLVSNGNVTGVVEKLVGDGLVHRENLALDRRAFLVRMTPKGKDLMAEMSVAHRGWLNELLGTLEEDEIARTIATMVDIRRTLRSARDADQRMPVSLATRL